MSVNVNTLTHQAESQKLRELWANVNMANEPTKITANGKVAARTYSMYTLVFTLQMFD